MSQNNQSEQQEELPNSSVLGTIRKASDSTAEMAQYIKSQQFKTKPSGNQSEIYDQQLINELSSGVYQIDHFSSEQEPESPENVPSSKEKSPSLETSPKKSQAQQNTKLSTEQPVDFEYQKKKGEEKKNNQVKVVEQDQPQRLQWREMPKQEIAFVYPSLMDESNTEGIMSKHQGGKSLQPFKAKMEPKKQQVEIVQSDEEEVEVQHEHAQVIYRRQEQEDVSEEAKKEMEMLSQKIQEELHKQARAEREAIKMKETVTESELIQLQREDSKPIPVIESPYILSNRRQVEESQKFIQSKLVNEVPTKPLIRIIGYEKEYFLKMETQVYQIEFSSPKKTYVFCRKYSDFFALNKMIKQQYPGFILHPFPEKSLEFFTTLKFSVGNNQREKIIMIEQRLLGLQLYLNFILNHRELGQCQFFEIFISESKDLFSKQFLLLEQAIDKAQQMYSSSKLKDNINSLKSMVKSSINFLGSYVTSSPSQINHENPTLMLEIKRKAEILLKNYDQISEQLTRDIQICNNLQIKIQKLIQIYRFNKELNPIQSSIDSVLKFSTKTASSKAYYEQLQIWLEDHLLREIVFFSQSFTNIEESIEYRTKLLQRVSGISVEEAKLAVALIERAEQFDQRFLEDWPVFHSKFQNDYLQMLEEFRQKWDQHCKLMSKIWK